MDTAIIIWIIIFFIFALTLLFIWGKLYLLNRHLDSIGVIVQEINGIDQQFSKLGNE